MGNTFLSTVLDTSEQLFERPPPALARTVHHAISAAGRALRRVERLASCISTDCIVGRRYVGALAGGDGGTMEMLYVGREEFAREFEVYFRGAPGGAVEPPATTFRGNLAQYALSKARFGWQAANADLVVTEMLRGPCALASDDAIHFPMLDGSLRVERSIDAQLRRVRSRTQRRLMRDVLRQDRYRVWEESDPRAFDAFREKLHVPYVRARFGDRGVLDDPQKLRELYWRRGRILLVAARERPAEPVGGTLLLDGRPNCLSYQINGFALDSLGDERLMAERTAALELAVMKHAIERRFERINFGYTRAILTDGLFVHKRRLGCTFSPVPGSPCFRVRARPKRRSAIFGAFPLLAGDPSAWTAVLGYDDERSRAPKRVWRAALKNFRVPGLVRAVVWTNTRGERERDPAGEVAFREAVCETLDLPDGVEFRTDE